MSVATEKLRAVAEMNKRVHAKIVERADKLLARETVIMEKSEKAFSPHEQMLDAREKDLNDLEREIDLMTNGGPEGPLPGSEGSANG